MIKTFVLQNLFDLRNYFIIENNTNSINSIKKVLDGFEEYHCVGISDEYENALNTILKESPNLVFFNIDDVVEQPFNLIQELNQFSNSIPNFVAITSTKEKSYEVIKNGFYDLLLNPLTDLEIRKSILKFQKKNPIENKQKICLKSYKDYQYIDTEEILYLKADNNTTDFYLKNGRIVNSYKTLKTFEKLLPPNFIRVHKSFMINKKYVSRIQFGKSTCTIKQAKLDIPFSKTYLDSIEEMNNILSECSIQTLN